MTNQRYYNYMWRTLSTAYIKGIGKTVTLAQALFSLLGYTFFADIIYMIYVQYVVRSAHCFSILTIVLCFWWIVSGMNFVKNDKIKYKSGFSIFGHITPLYGPIECEAFSSLL